MPSNNWSGQRWAGPGRISPLCPTQDWPLAGVEPADNLFLLYIFTFGMIVIQNTPENLDGKKIKISVEQSHQNFDSLVNLIPFPDN